MTPVPEDDLEQALRRALSAAVNRVEPGPDGLEQIRARTKKRPPQPWLLAVAGGALSRVRYWVWRGHWAWPDRFPRPSALPRPSSLNWPRLRRLPLPAGSTLATRMNTGQRGGRLRRLFAGPDGANWLRPVGVLAGVAFIAAIALGVPTFRSTIVQVSSNVLTGGQSSGGSGTDGTGTPASTGTSPGGATSSGATGTGAAHSAGAAGTAGTSGCTQSAGGSAQGGSGANPGPTAVQVTSGPGIPRYRRSPRTRARSPRPARHPAAPRRLARRLRPRPSRPARRPATGSSPTSTPTGTGSSPTSTPTGTGSSPTSTPTGTGTPTSTRQPDGQPVRLAVLWLDPRRAEHGGEHHEPGVVERGVGQRQLTGERRPGRPRANLASMESLVPAAGPPVFLVPPGGLAANTVTLTGPEGHHAAVVRRLRPGERADVSDGAGTLAEGVVTAVTKDSVTLAVQAIHPVPLPRPADHRSAGPPQGRPRRTRGRTDDRGRRRLGDRLVRGTMRHTLARRPRHTRPGQVAVNRPRGRETIPPRLAPRANRPRHARGHHQARLRRHAGDRPGGRRPRQALHPAAARATARSCSSSAQKAASAPRSEPPWRRQAPRKHAWAPQSSAPPRRARRQPPSSWPAPPAGSTRRERINGR